MGIYPLADQLILLMPQLLMMLGS